MHVYVGDDGFLPALGIENVTGRNFFEGNSADTSSVFLNVAAAATYRKDVQFGRLARFFTARSILIACLGVVGLATFTAQRSTKEIGIRKAHDASVNSILALLCRDAVRWVIIACVIGLPLGYLVVQKWLANFAYRIDISVLTFLIAALTALLFALFSVILQTMRAARSNPADVLRYE